MKIQSIIQQAIKEILIFKVWVITYVKKLSKFTKKNTQEEGNM